MSYILDALRKADAERVRGALPDLHTQPVLPASSAHAPRPLWLIGSAAALALTLAGAAVTWLLLGARHPVQPRVVTGIPSVSVSANPLLAPASTVAVAAAALVAPVAAARAAVPVTVSALTRAPERPAALQRSANANESIQRPGPTPSQTAAPVVSAAMLAEPREPREPRIYALNELPEPIRRELPTLTVGGAMHSDHPASRMLILNGQVFHERDLIAPNLTLVQVQLKSALLEFRGYRYRITY